MATKKKAATPVAKGRKGGGKGGGASRAPREAPNTLRSKATAIFLDVLGEGPIEGLVNGYQSVFINDTQLQNSDGSYNFKGLNLAVMGGYPDQGTLPAIEAVNGSSEVAVGVEVKNATGPVVRTITAVPTTSVRVTIRIPALYQSNPSNGDINPYDIGVRVELRSDSNAWLTAVEDPISGKCTAPYEKSYRLGLPAGTSQYQIRVTKTTPDNDSDVNKVGSLFWVSYTRCVDWSMTYPDTAYVMLGIDSESFGNALPTRSYEVKGLKVKIPSNYNPITRVYTGTWDGTFGFAWTDNPAWIFYDLLTNTRYGLGMAIPAASVDKWSLYTIAQYCDGLVPNGLGGYEPRFTFNGVINTLEDAYSQLQTIAACFRGMVYYGAGIITATQDAPTTPSKLVTNANVIDGVFSYEGTALKARHTVCQIIFSDKDNAYNPTVEFVDDTEGLAKWGLRPIEIQGVGITSRTQARRIGKWILDSEKHETETVTYRCGVDHADVRPGDVILVQDRWYTALRMGGRVVSATTTSLTIDYPITVVGGFTHSLRMTMPDGSIVERVMTNAPGGTTTLTWTTALTTLPQVDSVWLISVTDATPGSGAVAARPFRVLSLLELEKSQYQVTALFFDTTKYDRVELNIAREPQSFTSLPTGAIQPPAELATEEFLYLFAGSARAGLTTSWKMSRDPRVVLYQVEAIRPGQTSYQYEGETPTNSFDIQDITDGLMSIRVRAVDPLGRYSAWAYLTDITTMGLKKPPQDVTGFEFSAIGDMMRLSWLPVKEHKISYYRIRYNANIGAATWEASIDVVPRVDGLQVDIPLRDGAYLIKAVTLSEAESTNATMVANTYASIMKLNVEQTLQQHTTWTQTKYHTALQGGSVLGIDSLNKVTNPTVTGGTAGTVGSGGVMPTGWSITTPAGCTAVLAFGTESGTPYLQVQWTGTTSGTNQDFIIYPNAASGGFYQNDVVSYSANGWKSSGTLPSGATLFLDMQELNSSSTILTTNSTSATLFTTAASLAAGAVSATYTLPSATADKARLGIRMRVPTSGTSVNVTWRFALPDFHNVLTTGTYTFQSNDYGSVYSCRLRASLAGGGVLANDYMAFWTTLSGVPTMASGSATNWSAILEFRTTVVDPALNTWGEWQAFQMTDVEARAIQFRLTISSLDNGNTMPQISELTVSVDMPDRTEGDNNVSIASGGTTITFAEAFRDVPAIAVTGQNLATGDYWTISGQTAAGFTVQFKNAAGTGVARTCDWIAKGYGRLIP